MRLAVPAMLLSSLLTATVHAQSAAAPSPPLAVQAVADGVFVHFGRIADWGAADRTGNGDQGSDNDDRGDVANLAFIVGSRCVAVIDTGGTPALGQRLRAAIAERTPAPVCYVINTHAHPDHLLGNAAFVAAGVRFVASKKYSAALAAREPYFFNALKRDFGLAVTHDDATYPTLAVEHTLTLDLGERSLELHAWPTAHTDNDLTVFDATTRTLFLGDLLFATHLPVIDGSLRGWLKVMADLQLQDVALAVPGHGPLSRDWRSALAPQRAYLEAVLRETRAAIKSRVGLAEAVESVGKAAAAPWQLADEFHHRNVTAAYAELEWEE